MKNLILIPSLFISASVYADTVDRFFIQAQLGIKAADECISSNNKRSNDCQEFRVINDDISSILKKKTNRDEIIYRANAEQQLTVTRYNFRADKINAMLTRH